MTVSGAIFYACALVCGIIAVPLRKVLIGIGVVTVAVVLVQIALHLVQSGLTMPTGEEFLAWCGRFAFAFVGVSLWFLIAYGVAYGIGHLGRKVGILRKPDH